jgi:hypothetical protein
MFIVVRVDKGLLRTQGETAAIEHVEVVEDDVENMVGKLEKFDSWVA